MTEAMHTLLRQLRTWQRREWLYRFAWGLARCVAVVLVALFVACLLDWVIDRNRDTPFALRIVMTVAQIGLAIGAVWTLLVRLQVPSLDALAAKAERAIPTFGHRLVTALQLNRDAAKTQGMSPQLIAEVTREAEDLVSRSDLPQLADATRLKRAIIVLAPVLFVVGGLFAWQPALVSTLVARQCLLPVEIARSINLKNQTTELWPAGDAVVVRLEVRGPISEDAIGVLKVYPEDQPTETFELNFAERVDADTGIFTTQLPPSSSPFTFRAWLSGGRLRQPGQVRFEARPVVKTIEAYVVLPKYVDPRGEREYKRYQSQGEVYASLDSFVEVQAEFTKPVASATVVIYSRDEKGKDFETSRIPMKLASERDTASSRFALPPRPSGYRIEVVDDNGFKNLNPPFRGITLAPDRPPEVRLLPECLKDPKEDGPLDDFLVDGMPLRLGGQVQVGYLAKSPIGISKAYIVYRVNDGPWTPLPLANTDADLSKLGKFLPELGVFTESGAFGQVELYQLSSTNPDLEPSGLQAGGRYNFKTSTLKKKIKVGDSTKESELEVGDTVEIRVAVYDRNPAEAQPPSMPPRFGSSSSSEPVVDVPDTRRPAGWSPESRIKQVVSEAKFEAWRQEHYRTRVKLSELEQKQRAVFQAPK